MIPKPYPRGSNLSPRVRELLDQGALVRLPRQYDRQDLDSTDGVDIVYDLRGMTPARFARFVDQLLVAAEWECRRYPELEYRYGRFVLRLNTSGGDRNNIRVYTAALSSDIDTMIYGNPGDIPTELGGTGKSLADKAEAIINMLSTGSPGAYVNRQNPYRVTQMVISVRERTATTRRRERAQDRLDTGDIVRVSRTRPSQLEEGTST